MHARCNTWTCGPDRPELLGIDAAFIGSCTNGRIADLRSAARVLAGRQIAPGVRALCVPGSSRVKRQAEAEGLDQYSGGGLRVARVGLFVVFLAGGEDLGSVNA